jgi:hypothetical protein
MMNPESPMKSPEACSQAASRQAEDKERQLDELLVAYRAACPDIDPGNAFMPAVWAKIEEREVSTNWFGRIARALVTAAVAASAILAMMLSSFNQSNEFLNATFVDALRADQVAALEPFHVDHIAEMEQQ